MEPNFKWLWAAFSVAWAMHVAYIVFLSGRTSALARQMEDLRKQMERNSNPESTRKG